jgi:hypothetical protein
MQQIEDLGTSLHEQLKEKAKQFLYCSLVWMKAMMSQMLLNN